MLDGILACAAVGAPDIVRARLEGLVARTGADELMVTSQIHNHAARLRSYEMVVGL
jgi:alkanesulfonate monooxygenase SsuD/methylene tetrahydromethanopterin reductase-like flavin-dependent oxidoreductase (luciferase family)